MATRRGVGRRRPGTEAKSVRHATRSFQLLPEQGDLFGSCSRLPLMHPALFNVDLFDPYVSVFLLVGPDLEVLGLLDAAACELEVILFPLSPAVCFLQLLEATLKLLMAVLAANQHVIDVYASN